MDNKQIETKTEQLENNCYITGPCVNNEIVGNAKFYAPTQCQNCTGYDEYEGYYAKSKFIGIIKIIRADGSLLFADARTIKISPTNKRLNSIANGTKAS